MISHQQEEILCGTLKYFIREEVEGILIKSSNEELIAPMGSFSIVSLSYSSFLRVVGRASVKCLIHFRRFIILFCFELPIWGREENIVFGSP